MGTRLGIHSEFSESAGNFPGADSCVCTCTHSQETNHHLWSQIRQELPWRNPWAGQVSRYVLLCSGPASVC